MGKGNGKNVIERNGNVRSLKSRFAKGSLFLDSSQQTRETCRLPDWDCTLHHRQDDMVSHERHDEVVEGGNKGRYSPPPSRNHTLRHSPPPRSRRWHSEALRNHGFSISLFFTFTFNFTWLIITHCQIYINCYVIIQSNQVKTLDDYWNS